MGSNMYLDAFLVTLAIVALVLMLAGMEVLYRRLPYAWEMPARAVGVIIGLFVFILTLMVRANG